MQNETVDYDDEIITTLKEHQINRSYWTHVNAKGNLLAFIKKGVFTSWPQMNASKLFTNVTKNAEKW